MSYVACLLAFGLFYVVRTYFPHRLSRVPYVQYLPFALLAIGTVTLADTAIGGLVARWGIGPLFSGFAALITAVTGASVSRALLAGVAFTVLAVAAIFDLIDGKVDGIAKTAIIVLPFLALVAVGPFADAGSGLFAAVAGAGTEVMASLVGR